MKISRTAAQLAASFQTARLALGVVCALGLAFTAHVGAADKAMAADGDGAYATKRHRNLFAEIGKSPADIRRKIDGAFRQLFHGDPATQAIYYEAGSNSNGPLACVTDIKHRDVRSEGLSYGMMIAVQLDKKAEFDAIWNWSKTFLYVTETNLPSYGFFAWQARNNARAHESIRGAGWRGVLRNGALLRGASLGQGTGHLRLQSPCG